MLGNLFLVLDWKILFHLPLSLSPNYVHSTAKTALAEIKFAHLRRGL